MNETKIQDNGLSIYVGSDGTWLTFKASSSKSATLHVEKLAERHIGIVGAALREWCADQAKKSEAEIA